MSGAAQRRDMVSVLTADHRAVEKAFDELESGQGSPDRLRDLADHLVAELVRHFVAEEQYLYTTVRDVLARGDELADHEVEHHAQAEQLMRQLEQADPEAAEFTEIVSRLSSSVRDHMRDEEDTVFPKLQRACSPGRLGDLGNQVQQAKEAAPTRPHPSAEDQPPGTGVVDAGAGLVDRMREAFTGRNR